MIEEVEMGGEPIGKCDAEASICVKVDNEEVLEKCDTHVNKGVNREVPKICEREASKGNNDVNGEVPKICEREASKGNNDVGCVCVTGAGGFIASWLVKHLLEKGYTVKGAVRNPDDPKNAHLKQLEGASERLVLAKADLMNFDSILSVINGCDGVFHLASPVTDDPVQMVEPAIKGTLNVLDASTQCGVKRIVMTSSIGAVYMDPNRDPNIIVDEACWSDLDYCKDTKNWYCYGKTVAEKAAWDYAKEKGIDLVVLHPSLVLGPLLQSAMNASTNHLLKYLTGSAKTYANLVQAYVDVRDVADACILLYETLSASGRYLCAESVAHRGDICDLLADLFPQYPIPRKCSDEKRPRVQAYEFTNKKLCNLGLVFTPLKKCLYDTVLSLQEKNIIST